VTVTTLEPAFDVADLADRVLRSAAELSPMARAELAAMPATAVNLALAFGTPNTDAGWARLEGVLLILACKDESLLDDALGYL